ncbi:MAG: hypothetical protein JO157_05770 [Acetobacteraceae bacterium]|nr:hypothetical protein [Acetobacteraceae bacterium]
MADLRDVGTKPRPITVPLVNRIVCRSPGRPESPYRIFIAPDATAIDEPTVLARLHDDLGPARGIAAALLLALSFWYGIALVTLW